MRYIGRDQAVRDSIMALAKDLPGNHITVMDSDQQFSDPNPRIVVGQELDNKQLTQMVADLGVSGVVQRPNIDFERQMKFCAQVLSEPQAFFANPIDFITGQSRTGLLQGCFEIFAYPLSLGDKDTILERVREDLKLIPKSRTVVEPAALIADEMLMNIMKDAPLYFAKNSPELDSSNRTGRLMIAHDGQRLVIWTEDDYGSLSVDKMMRRLKECYQEEQIDPLMQNGQGAGLGCKMILDNCVSMSVFVKPGIKTVFCALLPLGLSNRQLQSLPKNLQVVALSF